LPWRLRRRRWLMTMNNGYIKYIDPPEAAQFIQPVGTAADHPYGAPGWTLTTSASTSANITASWVILPGEKPAETPPVKRFRVETIRGPWFSLGIHVDLQKRYVDLHILWWVVSIGGGY